MNTPVKIIDLFAGPGGLGEGFSSLTDSKGNPLYKIALSIEKEVSAHKTLSLRAFYRQFKPDNIPNDYYKFIKGELGKTPSEELFKIKKLNKFINNSFKEAKCLTLGIDNNEINNSIEDALGKNPAPWVLIGGPPCQAYSIAGRARNISDTAYSAKDDHRNFLYKEYLSVIAKFSPSIFVMENVKGMLSAKIDGKKIISQILSDLKKPHQSFSHTQNKSEYEIFSLSNTLSGNNTHSDFTIKSENYGIPQARHRVILLGIKTDLLKERSPSLLKEEAHFVTVGDILSDLPKLRSGLSKLPDSALNWEREIRSNNSKIFKELDSIGLTATSEYMAQTIEDIQGSSLSRGSNWGVIQKSKVTPTKLTEWYLDPMKNKIICNHETRGHISSDLKRYLFSASYGLGLDHSTPHSPKAKDYPKALAPNHSNWESGNFSDRFRVQITTKYATTITCHISKDGHYFIHPDPKQCRSLTVREAARIQTFPDNYFFVGNRTQQYVQVGNAVPPLLAHNIAKIVAKQLGIII